MAAGYRYITIDVELGGVYLGRAAGQFCVPDRPHLPPQLGMVREEEQKQNMCNEAAMEHNSNTIGTVIGATP